jgi:hypothetical protein
MSYIVIQVIKMAAVEISCPPVMRNVTLEPFDVPSLNVEKAVKAVQTFIRELEESEARNQQS